MKGHVYSDLKVRRLKSCYNGKLSSMNLIELMKNRFLRHEEDGEQVWIISKSRALAKLFKKESTILEKLLDKKKLIILC